MKSKEHLLKTITSSTKFEELRLAMEATKETPVFVEGTWNFNSEFVLWYKDGETSKKITFPNFDEVELKRLSDACQPATRGITSFRKLDNQDFTINTGYTLYEMISHGVRRLLGVPYEGKNFTAELDQLQVYGPGSFREQNPNALTNADAFGTFVLVLPTERKGGDVLLCASEGVQGDVLRAPESVQVPDSHGSVSLVSWAAFWKGANHEVKPVSVGYQVVLTFNLSFSDSPPPIIASRVAPEAPALFDALRNSLADPTFLPLGGFLGFGLKHKYAFTKDSELQDFRTHLKGCDGSIVNVGDSFGLKLSLRAFYDAGDYGCGKASEKRWLMTEKILCLGDCEGIPEDMIAECLENFGDMEADIIMEPDPTVNFVVHRGFFRSEVRSWRGDNPSVLKIVELCDVGTAVHKKVLEPESKECQGDEGDFSQVVSSSDASNQAVYRASPREPFDEALVINWVAPMNRSNPIGFPLDHSHRPGVMGHPFGSINLILEIPPLESRQRQIQNASGDQGLADLNGTQSNV
ncbi:hypothetical protein SISNIDRAFT_470274 [Sistotremastrum niveocremeum HHB9708]|uniref:Fe2OG dioxygenase domain-containing protein n=1 Tax=Sistotremastrum niveocremeum HHB9708 TaxID=1314777 RepID=A0A164P1T5_9AGAM|nr:hypothetical protein SISNIDRAFT_470274 [Sistotremastrum niveocremeum HHB9708]